MLRSRAELFGERGRLNCGRSASPSDYSQWSSRRLRLGCALVRADISPAPGCCRNSRLITPLPFPNPFPGASVEHELQTRGKEKPPFPAGFSVGAAGIEPATSRV